MSAAIGVANPERALPVLPTVGSDGSHTDSSRPSVSCLGHTWTVIKDATRALLDMIGDNILTFTKVLKLIPNILILVFSGKIAAGSSAEKAMETIAAAVTVYDLSENVGDLKTLVTGEYCALAKEKNQDNQPVNRAFRIAGHIAFTIANLGGLFLFMVNISVISAETVAAGLGKVSAALGKIPVLGKLAPKILEPGFLGKLFGGVATVAFGFFAIDAAIRLKNGICDGNGGEIVQRLLELLGYAGEMVAGILPILGFANPVALAALGITALGFGIAGLVCGAFRELRAERAEEATKKNLEEEVAALKEAARLEAEKRAAEATAAATPTPAEVAA